MCVVIDASVVGIHSFIKTNSDTKVVKVTCSIIYLFLLLQQSVCFGSGDKTR